MATPYTHVQSAVNTTLVATTSRAQAFATANITAGNMIFGWIWVSDASGSRITSPSVSDDQGQTYNTLLKAVTSGGSFLFFWFLNSVGGVKPTVTATWTGSKSTSAMVVHEFGGVPSNFTIDQSGTHHATSGTALNSGSITPTFPNEFAFGAMWNSGANNLTDPPTVLPASSNNAIGAHGKVTSPIYADQWVQVGDDTASFNLGFTLSSSIEVSDVGMMTLGAQVPNFVSKQNFTKAGNTATFGAGQNMGGLGRLVFVVLTYIGGSSESSLRSVTDSNSNTFVELAHGYNSTNSVGISIQVCYSYNNSNLGTVTASVDVGMTELNASLVTTSLTGYNTPDGSSVTSYTANSTTLSAGSFTPAHNNDLIICALNTTSTSNGMNLRSDVGLWVTNLIALSGSIAEVDSMFVQATAAAINPRFVSGVGRKGIVAAVALASIPSTSTNQLMMTGCGM